MILRLTAAPTIAWTAIISMIPGNQLDLHAVERKFNSVPIFLDALASSRRSTKNSFPTHWKHGIRDHSGERQHIIGFVTMRFWAPCGTSLLILYLYGPSHSVVEKNVRIRSKILHLCENCMVVVERCKNPVRLPLIDSELHTFLRFSQFSCSCSPETQCLWAANTSLTEKIWCTLRDTIDRAHEHSCGQRPFGNVMPLFQRTEN